ncbi:MAG TPA: PAS domain S-box protein, partial [Bryobacteraceae bacterium]|nr:PAS domain S-box protein [Bryobacteraceae bacterium]
MDSNAEVLRLRRALREVVALSTIPAAWTGREPADIAIGLADVLVASLHLDFAFVRLCDPSGGRAAEVTRGNGANPFLEWLEHRLAVIGQFSRKEIVLDLGGEEPYRGIVIPIGINGEAGLAAVACNRADFPSEIDQLVLSVATNHAATAFRNARLIRERREAEEALREKEELNTRILESTQDCIKVLDTGGELLYMSPGGLRMFEVDDPRDVLGQNWVALWQGEDRKRATEAVENARRGHVATFQGHRSTLRGTSKWWDVVVGPIRGRSGVVERILAVSRDITAFREAERAVRDSEERWRTLTRTLPQLVWAATPDGEIEYVGPQLVEYSGVPESDVLGWDWLKLLHPDDCETTRRVWMDAVAERRIYDLEFRIRRHDGVYGWFETRGAPVRDSAGKIVKWFGTCTDITDRKRIEVAMRESEELFRGAFENAAVGMVHTTMDGIFLHVNDKFCNITGYGREELVGRRAHEITHPEDVAREQEIKRRIAAIELTTDSWEKRYVRKDGSIVFANVTASVLRDSSGEPLHLIGIVEDISARKRAEKALYERTAQLAYVNQQLAQSNEQLARASRLKSEFLSRMSHELRTPINAILGFSDVLAEQTEGPLGETYTSYVEHIRDGAAHLLTLINELLDLSKIEAGRVELSCTEINVADGLAEV